MSAIDAIAAAIEDASKARARVTKNRQSQVRSAEERQYLAAIAHTWFRSRRPAVLGNFSQSGELLAIDSTYQRILDSADKSASRATYLDALRRVKEQLMALRAVTITA